MEGRSVLILFCYLVSSSHTHRVPHRLLSDSSSELDRAFIGSWVSSVMVWNDPLTDQFLSGTRVVVLGSSALIHFPST